MKTIGPYAFENCINLSSFFIHKNVENIGRTILNGCFGIESIIIESGNKNYDSRDNCNAIIETASNTLILGCKNTIIPNSITNISKYAFFGIKGLQSIKIPNGFTNIEEATFCGCYNLVSIALPNSLSNIESAAFESCLNLPSITIPQNVKSLGKNVFRGCDKLESIKIFAPTPPSAYAETFYQYNIPLYVPSSSIDLYKSRSPWNKFETIKAIESTAVDVTNSDNIDTRYMYTLNGMQTRIPQRGINIIQKGNGKARKVVIK